MVLINHGIKVQTFKRGRRLTQIIPELVFHPVLMEEDFRNTGEPLSKKRNQKETSSSATTTPQSAITTSQSATTTSPTTTAITTPSIFTPVVTVANFSNTFGARNVAFLRKPI